MIVISPVGNLAKSRLSFEPGAGELNAGFVPMVGRNDMVCRHHWINKHIPRQTDVLIFRVFEQYLIPRYLLISEIL